MTLVYRKNWEMGEMGRGKLFLGGGFISRIGHESLGDRRNLVLRTLYRFRVSPHREYTACCDMLNLFDSCTECRRALLSGTGKRKDAHNARLFFCLSPRQESNLHHLLRREVSYPLNDEGS